MTRSTGHSHVKTMATIKRAGSASKVSRPTSIEIVREATFVRLTADNAILVDRGDDVEISLIVHEKRVFSRDLSGDAPLAMAGGKYNLGPSLVEIGKVRITPEVAVNLAMSILAEAIESDRINLEAFKDTIQSMIETSPEVKPPTAPARKSLKRPNKP